MIKDIIINMKPLGIILIGAIILIFAASIYIKIRPVDLSNITQTSNSIISQTNQIKTYQSKNLQFNIGPSNDWKIDEGNAFVNLNNNYGKINLSRIATNFYNLSDYLKDFDSKRTVKIDLEESLMIDGYDSIKRTENFTGGSIIKQKVYYIFIDSWVYSLSTSSESLYDELDQIAKSFRYTP